MASLPLRGAWIEIYPSVKENMLLRRSPCGERGLKSYWCAQYKVSEWSLPLRGAWIEID